MDNSKFSARVRNTITTGEMHLTVRDLRYMLSIINNYLDVISLDKSVSQDDIDKFLASRKTCQKLLTLKKTGKI